jgi:uncharacterized protein (DUF486 family)
MTPIQTVAFTATLLALSNQVPAKRAGFAGGMSLAQLKILQDWAGLCLVGAVYFIFAG